MAQNPPYSAPRRITTDVPQVRRIVTPAAARSAAAEKIAAAVNSVPGASCTVADVRPTGSQPLVSASSAQKDGPAASASASSATTLSFRVDVVLTQLSPIPVIDAAIRRAVTEVHDGPLDIRFQDIAAAALEPERAASEEHP